MPARMNGIDFVLAVLLLAFALRGFWRGMFFEVMSVASVVVGCGAGLLGARALAPWVVDTFALPQAAAAPVAFFLVFFPVVAAVRLLRMIGQRMLPEKGESPLNALGGLFLGTFKGVLLVGAVVALLRTPVTAPDVAYAEPLRASVIEPLERFQTRLEGSALAVGLAGLSMGFFSVLIDFKQDLAPSGAGRRS